MIIPTKSICPNHQAPFDFVAAVFFELFDLIIAVANRSGGKTLDFAVLTLLEAFANDDCECANFGAIQMQALRCYNYMKAFMEKQPDFYENVKGDITMKKTEFINGSLAQVLVATMSGVNSPHPQKVKADEFELIPWPITQEALSMPQSKNGIDAVTVLGSTRKFAHGPVQRMIDDGEAKVFMWCTWEVMEPWPFDDVMMQQKIKNAIIKKFGDLSILPQDLTRFNGYYKWKDLIAKIRSLDIETLRTQWFCEKADSTGLIYPKFDEVLNSNPHFVVDPNTQLSLQIWEDFGYAKSHPNCISFVAVDYMHESFVQFDELKLVEMQTQDIIIEVIIKLMKHKLVDPSVLEDVSTTEQEFELRKKLKEMHNYSAYFTIVRLWIPDYHGLTERADRKGMGCPIPNPAKITHESIHPECKIENCSMKKVSDLYLKENGIPHVRNFIDERRAKITPNCVETRDMFLAYAYRKRQDGTYSDEPLKEDDHFPDTWHYGTVYNWYNIAYQPSSLESAMGDDALMPEQKEGTSQRDFEGVEEYDEIEEELVDTDGSPTSDLWNKVL